jgi:hypothetical protein
MTILPIFAILFVVSYAVTFVFRKLIGEARWAKLMRFRRSRR